MTKDSIILADILQIVEVFRTIIGESRYAGIPCTLVRLGGCNLDCKYCDTQYARKSYNFEEHIFDTGQKIKDQWVLLTGGEPLLQDAAIELIEVLLNREKKVVLETNGSIDLSNVPEQTMKIMDIKTPSSGMSKKMNFENIKYLKDWDEVKFVIANDDDFRFAMKIIDDYNLLDKCAVSFSPVFGEIASDEIAQAILKTMKPIRLNLQLHKMIGIK